jgi:hypothetical protein
LARYGAWRPLADNWAAQPELTTPDIICLHTMAGSLAGTEAEFRKDGYGGVESHFGVGADGGVYQWQDTTRQAEANYRGNGRIISIETADRGPGFSAWAGSDVPAWTAAQLDVLSKLVAFLCRTHNIPCSLIPDSKPGRRGIGYHRMGIDPWRVIGGEVWSTSRGKVCPGDRRVAQVPTIIARARNQEDDMPSAEEVAKAVWDQARKNGFGDTVSAWQVVSASDARTAALQAQVNNLQAQMNKLAADVAAIKSKP